MRASTSVDATAEALAKAADSAVRAIDRLSDPATPGPRSFLSSLGASLLIALLLIRLLGPPLLEPEELITVAALSVLLVLVGSVLRLHELASRTSQIREHHRFLLEISKRVS